MPRRQALSSPFKSAKEGAKPSAKAAARAASTEEPPVLTLHQIPDEEEEDPELKKLREQSEAAALVLQRSWSRRPRWSADYALEVLGNTMASRPPSGRDISHAERRRLASMGLAVPSSLNFDETPIPVFLDILRAVARHREGSEGGPPEGGVRGRLEGVFYEIGSGVGTVAFAAALYHNFSHVVGFEILQGLFDKSLEALNYFTFRIKPRLLVRADRDLTHIRFVVGDATALRWSKQSSAQPSIVYCHCSVWDDALMLKLAEKLAPLPLETIVVTLSNPVPSYEPEPGREPIVWDVLERLTVPMPWGPATAFIHQRRMNSQEAQEAVDD